MSQGVTIPEAPSPNGLFAVHYVQSEMYDLGNIDDISRYALYDRGAGVIIEITAEVNQAPLLSWTNPATVHDCDAVDLFEKLLKKEITEFPEDPGGFPALVGFHAREVTADEFVELRARMSELKVAKLAHDEAIANFESSMKSSGQRLGFAVPLLTDGN